MTFKNPFHSPRKASRKTSPDRTRLQLETLEDRCTPSTGLGGLEVTGTDMAGQGETGQDSTASQVRSSGELSANITANQSGAVAQNVSGNQLAALPRVRFPSGGVDGFQQLRIRREVVPRPHREFL